MALLGDLGQVHGLRVHDLLEAVGQTLPRLSSSLDSLRVSQRRCLIRDHLAQIAHNQLDRSTVLRSVRRTNFTFFGSNHL